MKKQMRRLLGIIISAMLLITYAFPVMADPHNHHSGDTPIEYKKDDALTITLTKPKDDNFDNTKAKYGAYQIFSGTVPAEGSDNAPKKEDLTNPGTNETLLPITDIKWGDAFGKDTSTWQANIVNFVLALANASEGKYGYAFEKFIEFKGFAGTNKNELAERFYYTGQPRTNENVNFDKLAVEVAQVLAGEHDREWLQAFTDILGGYTAEYAEGNFVHQYYKGDWVGDSYQIKVPAGYYMILDLSEIDKASEDDYSEAYSARMLFVANNVTQELKSSVPTLDKRILRNDSDYETEAAGVGDTVTFRLTGTLPANYDNYLVGYKYIFTDTLSKGLTLDETSVKVTVTGLWDKSSSGKPVWYEGTPLSIDENSFLEAAPNHQHIGDKAYKVTVTPATATEGQKLTVSFPCLKEIVIDNKYSLGYNEDGTKFKSSQIYVEYTATLNKDAVVEPADSSDINGNKNAAQLEYSDNPQASEDTDKTTIDDATVYTFGLDITKVNSAEFTKDPDAETAKLADAEFVLVRENPNIESSSKYQIAIVENDGSINSWINLPESVTKEDLKKTVTGALYLTGGTIKPTYSSCVVTSDENGKINITGLNDNVEYTMVEVKAPDGYATIDPFTFTLTAAEEKNGEGEDTGEYNGLLEKTDIKNGESETGKLSLTQYVINKNKSSADTNGLSELTVANFKYEDLPSTGGIGTYIFYIVGGIIVLGAVVLLFLSRKKKVTE